MTPTREKWIFLILQIDEQGGKLLLHRQVSLDLIFQSRDPDDIMESRCARQRQQPRTAGPSRSVWSERVGRGGEQIRICRWDRYVEELYCFHTLIRDVHQQCEIFFLFLNHFNGPTGGVSPLRPQRSLELILSLIPCLYLEVILLVPVHKALHQYSGCLLVVPNHRRGIRELLQVTN